VPRDASGFHPPYSRILLYACERLEVSSRETGDLLTVSNISNPFRLSVLCRSARDDCGRILQVLTGGGDSVTDSMDLRPMPTCCETILLKRI
jgi:hypothetical protein